MRNTWCLPVSGTNISQELSAYTCEYRNRPNLKGERSKRDLSCGSAYGGSDTEVAPDIRYYVIHLVSPQES
jgi:hypothetical protein